MYGINLFNKSSHPSHLEMLYYHLFYTIILFARWFLERKDSKISSQVGLLYPRRSINARWMILQPNSSLYEHTEESFTYGLSLNLVFVIKDV